jgi:hypothetical protein
VQAIAETETLRLGYGVRSPSRSSAQPAEDTGPLDTWDLKQSVQLVPRTTVDWGDAPDEALESTAIFLVGSASHLALACQWGAAQPPVWGGLAARIHEASWIDAQPLLQMARGILEKPPAAFVFADVGVLAHGFRCYVSCESIHVEEGWGHIRAWLGEEYHAPEPMAPTGVPVEVSRDADHLMTKDHLAGEFLRAKGIAEDVFPGVSEMRLELQADPSEEDAPPSLVLGIVSSATSADFRSARKRFFRMIRWAGCERLCLSLAVVRE